MWYGFAMKNEFVQTGNETAPLPMSRREMKARGIEQLDFVYIIGDAYIDHPSFGPAIISRVLESHGYTVGIISQPDWHDAEAFRALGRPKLGFLISSGNMDSMVNHYTSAKKRRGEDAYTEGGVAGRRPDRAVIVYSNRCREAYKNVPVIIGGIEASLRRFAHYDYWDDKVRRSVLCDSGADLLLYGMGERSVVEVADALSGGLDIKDITYIAGSCYMTSSLERVYDYELIESYEDVAADRSKYASAFMKQYREQDAIRGKRLVQPHGNAYIVVNPPSMPLSEEELDAVYDLPYTRAPHPSYRGEIPALKEVKFSLASCRGCFGGCSFCALTFHQGRVVQARSHASLIREAELMTHDREFKGYIHDVGGPTADFRFPACKKQLKYGVCADRQCLGYEPCSQMHADHSDYVELLEKLRHVKGVKKVFVRSGIRYDYMLQDKDKKQTFFRELVNYHISGQLKVAPEHCVSSVLDYMGKPHFDVFEKFWHQYRKLNEERGTEQYLVPYLMSSHPGCTLRDAVELAEFLHRSGRVPEQVQDFYPTPGTLSTCMYYTGIDPRNMSPVYVAKDPKEKAMQRALLQWSRPEKRALVVEALEETGRTDLIGYEKKCLLRPRKGEPYGQPAAKPEKPELPERRPRRKDKEAAGNRGRRNTPTVRQPAQKGKMSPKKKAAFAKKRQGK